MVSRWISIAVPAFALWLFQVSLFLRPARLDSRAYTQGLIAEANRALGEERHSDALDPLVRLTRAYPRNHVYQHQLAGVYQRLGQPDREALALERFVASSPVPFEACPRLGQADRELGRAADALRAFERCVAFAPDDPDMLLFHALALERAGDDRRAGELYRKAATLAPRYPDVAFGGGRVALRAGRAREALELVRPALERDPDSADGLLVAGLASLRLGELGAARAYLERGLRQRADDDLRGAMAQLVAAERKQRR